MKIQYHQPYDNTELSVNKLLLGSGGFDVKLAFYELCKLKTSDVFVFHKFETCALMMNVIGYDNTTAYVKAMTIELCDRIIGHKCCIVEIGGVPMTGYKIQNCIYVECQALIDSLRSTED